MADNKKHKNKFINAERVSIIVILAVILVLFAYFFKDIMLPLFHMQVNNDIDGASALLKEKGFMGGITVILIEALQMVIIFVSAEFIQISSGLSYPIYLSLPLCDIGICLGATIIFLLVRVFKFNSSTYEKNRGMIDKIASSAKDRNIVLLLYLLFFMPFIPFGAICYYGASTKISYGKYMLTVSTSAIPSVVVSVLIGQAGMAFFSSNIPLWLLVVIVILLSIALFALIYWFMHKFVLKDTDETPDSLFFDIFFMIVKLLQFGKKKPNIEADLIVEADAPYLMLSNHENFIDFFYLYYLPHLKSPSCIISEYYCTRPLFRIFKKHCGFIHKKQFSGNSDYKDKIRYMISKGFPVVIYPEGRRSPDGRSNPIVEKEASFYKELNVDIVLVKINGGYYAHPKWRTRAYSSNVNVTITRVLKREEIAAMTDEELENIISGELYNDASKNTITKYRQKDKAKGLEKLLYRCADCGALYKTSGSGNELKCLSCGAVHTIDEDYHFTGNIRSIPEYYDIIRKMEEKELGDISLKANVRVKIFDEKMKRSKKETGVYSLNSNAFHYSSGTTEFSIPISELPALSFKCGKRFELYHDDKLHFFYPEEDPVQVARWALIVDLLNFSR
ncbi:MAG: VTT domain-containing protein [Saccharofermentans sp.]|nr:VTT domain-containing protein [Saccharofermentans sp.]